MLSGIVVAVMVACLAIVPLVVAVVKGTLAIGQQIVLVEDVGTSS